MFRYLCCTKAPVLSFGFLCMYCGYYFLISFGGLLGLFSNLSLPFSPNLCLLKTKQLNCPGTIFRLERFSKQKRFITFLVGVLNRCILPLEVFPAV